AVRGLEDADTPLRVEELATALGYWAAYYQALPGVPHLTGTCAIDQALDQVPRIGRDYDWRVTPREFVRVLDAHPDFPKAVDAITAQHKPVTLKSMELRTCRVPTSHMSTPKRTITTQGHRIATPPTLWIRRFSPRNVGSGQSNGPLSPWVPRRSSRW